MEAGVFIDLKALRRAQPGDHRGRASVRTVRPLTGPLSPAAHDPATSTDGRSSYRFDRIFLLPPSRCYRAPKCQHERSPPGSVPKIGDTVVSIIRRRGRSRAIGGVTVAGFVLAAVFSPVAFADPVTTVHDFSTGAQGWFTYANTGTAIISSAATGEFCASVGDDMGDPWDHAMQHDSVTYDRNVTYTVAFDAHASRAVTVPMQGGAGYPDAFGHD